MKLPFRRPFLKVRHVLVRYIIFHHTYCLYRASGAVIDNSIYQLPYLVGNVMEKADPDINFHFIVEKIKDDYQSFVCRPMATLCDWPDIDPDINKRAIHIALMGNYDLKIPEKRMYEVLCYRLVAPLMKIFNIYQDSHLYFHNELSTDKTCVCPGNFLDMAIIKLFNRKFIMR